MKFRVTPLSGLAGRNTPEENTAYLLPFFIEWSADSIHPSADSPKGCWLLRFEAASPDPEELSKQVDLLGLDLPIVIADRNRE
jgi:hypothetical protein